MEDEIIHRNAVTSQHNSQKKITEKQQMPNVKIRRRIKRIERQLTNLNTSIDEHKKSVAEHKEIMNEHARLSDENKGKRQSFLQLDIQTRKYQVPQVDDHQKLRNHRQEIQLIVEEYEDISRKYTTTER